MPEWEYGETTAPTPDQADVTRAQGILPRCQLVGLQCPVEAVTDVARPPARHAATAPGRPPAPPPSRTAAPAASPDISDTSSPNHAASSIAAAVAAPVRPPRPVSSCPSPWPP